MASKDVLFGEELEALLDNLADILSPDQLKMLERLIRQEIVRAVNHKMAASMKMRFPPIIL